jgi:AAA domain
MRRKTLVSSPLIELPCGEGSPPHGRVLWLNAEDDPKRTIIPRLVAAGADISRVAFINATKTNDGSERPFSLITDLAILKKTAEQIGDVVLVIIDPVSAYLGTKRVDGRSATDVRSVLTPLKDLAEGLHVAIIGIAHFNKKDDVKSALLRVSDSIAYVAAARSTYAVLDDPEEEGTKLFVKAKNNLAADNTALRYGFGVKDVGYDQQLEKTINAPFIVWHPQHVKVTANEAMAAADGKRGYAKREAREFLLNSLARGAVLQTDILEEAEQEGISERTLMRAKRELRIKSEKEKGKTPAPWWWKLPPVGNGRWTEG